MTVLVRQAQITRSPPLSNLKVRNQTRGKEYNLAIGEICLKIVLLAAEIRFLEPKYTGHSA